MDTGPGTAKIAAAAAAHLHKDNGAVLVTHNQVNLTTTTSGRSIIAYQQTQACRLQMCQGPLFSGLAFLLCGGRCRRGTGCFFTEEFH